MGVISLLGQSPFFPSSVSFTDRDSTTYYCLVTVAKLELWYRHAGQPKIEDIPDDCTFKTIEDESEIIRDIGSHSITHMCISNGVIPSLEVVAPRLTHLRIRGITKSTQLQRYIYMSTH